MGIRFSQYEDKETWFTIALIIYGSEINKIQMKKCSLKIMRDNIEIISIIYDYVLDMKHDIIIRDVCNYSYKRKEM